MEERPAPAGSTAGDPRSRCTATSGLATPVGAAVEMATRLAGADGLLVGLDFDGTLAPIAADPAAPTIDPACRRAVERLASHPRASVAVVSGRALDDLRHRVGLPGLVYAGNHGLELDEGGVEVVHPVAARQRPAIRRVLDLVAEGLIGVPGWEIEDKGPTAAVHVRRTPPRRVDAVRETVLSAVRAVDGDLRVSTGKQVFEIRPAVDWDKGAAIRRLAAHVPDAWRTVYVGDDTTDEDAFRAVRPDGVGVLVGSRDSTASASRLPDQTTVAPFLTWLTERVLDRR
jgi:trehalose 6-phosphate phosphatase